MVKNNNLKFENLTTLIKIINNSLVKELNINVSDVKQNLFNMSVVIENNKYDSDAQYIVLLQKLIQFGTYLNTTLFQIFFETSTALFNSTFDELNSTVFIINNKLNTSDTKLINVETTIININEKLNNMTNLVSKLIIR